MANLKGAVAVLALAASAMILPCSLQNADCVYSSGAAFAKAHGAETIVEEQMHGKTYVVARVTVKAPPEKVFQILSDYDHADRVFPQVKRCKLVSDKGSSKIVKHEIAPSGLPATYEYMLEIKETAPHALEWHRLSGDFKQVDGYWKLEAADGGKSTHVTYASFVDGGLFMPQMLIRKQAKVDMAGVVNILKAQAETNACSVQIAGRPDHHPAHHVQ